MKKRLLYISIICMQLILIPQNHISADPVSAEDKIVMGSARRVDSADGLALKLIYTEAFKRVGKTLVFKYYPLKRGSKLADLGLIDGEIARVYGYNQAHPVLVRVEEPVLSVKLSAFTTDPDIKLNGWKSLSGTDYKVEYILGNYHSAKSLQKVVAHQNLSRVPHWSQGINKLIAGRTDFFIELENTVADALKTSEFKNSNIYIAGIMDELTIHAFLHKKHKELALQLSATLKDMKREGLIDKYLQVAKSSLKNQ